MAAVKPVCAHKTFFTTQVAEMVLQGHLKGNANAEEHQEGRNLLTSREKEIVQLLAAGKSNKEVGAALGISVNTVEAHRRFKTRLRGEVHAILRLTKPTSGAII